MGAFYGLGFCLLASACLAGCGGSVDGDGDEETSCSLVVGCGGDVVGVWDVVDLCVAELPVIEVPECAGAISYGQVDAAGQITFGADGQTASMANITFHVTYTFNSACASALAG